MIRVKHNSLASELDTRRLAAGERIEQSRAAEIRDDYEALTRELDDQSKQRKKLVDKRDEARRELESLSKDNFDPKPLVKQLNKDLSQILGRDDLSFAVAGQAYRIERNGSPATHLSEGERNAISLLYFLCSLSTHGTTASDCIIVIDDPVSSLDGNALAGASAHLWSQLVGKDKSKQVFLLTHNFELFRMWSNQLDRNQNHIQQEVATFELRTKIVEGQLGNFLRQPILISWPDDQKLRERLRSEYHFLFWRAASELVEYRSDPSIVREIEIATVLPNLCRRLLEAFLGFKAPEKMGNLHDQVMDTGSGTVSKAARTRILRFLHAYSHNQEANITAPVARPESVEIVSSVLEFMNKVDHGHFNSMCIAVGVDPARLQAALAVEDDDADTADLANAVEG